MTPWRRMAVAALGLAALYLALGPHELGHSAAAYAFGCKADWWRIDLSWYLWDSWGGRIDYACLERRGPLALGLTDGAGILVNLGIVAAAPLLGRWGERPRASTGLPWWFLATFALALANAAEAFSYLVVNTAWLSSDMRTVVEASGLSRWPWLLAGTALALGTARLLSPPARRAAESLSALGGAPRLWLGLFAAYVLIAGGAMATARVVLTAP